MIASIKCNLLFKEAGIINKVKNNLFKFLIIYRGNLIFGSNNLPFIIGNSQVSVQTKRPISISPV